MFGDFQFCCLDFVDVCHLPIVPFARSARSLSSVSQLKSYRYKFAMTNPINILESRWGNSILILYYFTNRFQFRFVGAKVFASFRLAFRNRFSTLSVSAMRSAQMAKSEIYVRTQSQTFAQTPDNLRKYIRVASTLEIEEGKKGERLKRKKLFNSYLTFTRMQNECCAFVQTKATEFMYGYSFKKDRKKCEKLNLKLHQKIKMGNLSHPPVHSCLVDLTTPFARGKSSARCKRGRTIAIHLSQIAQYWCRSDTNLYISLCWWQATRCERCTARDWFNGP